MNSKKSAFPWLKCLKFELLLNYVIRACNYKRFSPGSGGGGGGGLPYKKNRSASHTF